MVDYNINKSKYSEFHIFRVEITTKTEKLITQNQLVAFGNHALYNQLCFFFFILLEIFFAQMYYPNKQVKEMYVMDKYSV